MQQQLLVKLIMDKLIRQQESLSNQFLQQHPGTRTKFFILDDFLPEKIVLETFKNFPCKGTFIYRDTFRERKLTFAKLNDLPNPLIENMTDAFQSPSVIFEISKITKIPDLFGDQSLYAGGISRMDKSHFLNPHIDNSHDADRLRYRRLNILFYVSPYIKEQDGGNFELWNKSVTTPVKIESKFNRLVVMETTKTSWHSVDMVKSDLCRCCVSNYYFTKSSQTGDDYYHVTSFLGRPEQTFRRIYSRLDNFLRQFVSATFKVSRGKRLSRRT